MGRYAINGGKVNEEGHGKPWRALFRTGYIKGLNASQRSAGANMSVDVNLDSTLSFAAALIPTSANVAYIGWMDAVENVAVSAAHATLPRKDRLVAYIDVALITGATTNNQNAFKLMVVAGTAAASPVVPTSGTIQSAVGVNNPYIVLADINVAAATTTIVTANITDARTPAALNMSYLWGGSSNTSGHLVPNAADDTFALLNAIQTLKGKSLSWTGNTSTGNVITNPYKFRVYKDSAQNATAGAFAKIAFNKATYDSGSNFDIVTNYRFTAPVAGWYSFQARAGQASATNNVISLYKNGSEISRGSQVDTSPISATATGKYSVVADCIQLAASDYVEVYIFSNNATALDITSATCYFSGYLVSHL